MHRVFILTLISIFSYSITALADTIPNLQQVTTVGNTTTKEIIVDPQTDAFGRIAIRRLVQDTTKSQIALANNKSTGQITWHPAVNVSGTASYAINLGANSLIYYNNGTNETIWRSGNFNPASYLPLAGGSITGNLAVGQTSVPSGYAMAVNGVIGARKVKVTQENWPDYVFESTYQLPTLSAIEAYTKEHGHLPDIPSASEVATNGLDIGEVQKLQMQKIEELTLYMIQLSKQVAEQQKVIQQQQAIIKQLQSK